MTTALEATEPAALAQTISNSFVDIAHWVRLSPSDAREILGAAESVVADLRKLYELVGEP